MNARGDVVEEVLRAGQSAGGGWPAWRDGPSDAESTAWAVMALRSGGDVPFDASGRGSAAEAVAAGLRWLVESQRPDGGWAWSATAPRPGWCTAPAVMALSVAPDGTSAAARGGAWLLRERGRRSSGLARFLIRLLRLPRLVELDPKLRGWPWVPGTTGWVEPTGWALLALRATRPLLPEAEVRECVADGEALLLDRACVDGGWNYGNRTVLGEDLWPYPDTTAIALLGLAELREDPSVRAGADALEAMLEGPTSRLSLALAALALRAHRRDASRVVERLAEGWRQRADEATTRTAALSLLAFRGSLPPGLGPGGGGT